MKTVLWFALRCRCAATLRSLSNGTNGEVALECHCVVVAAVYKGFMDLLDFVLTPRTQNTPNVTQALFSQHLANIRRRQAGGHGPDGNHSTRQRAFQSHERI
jgi:hypothetical protein